MSRQTKFRGLTDTEALTWVYGSLVNNLWTYSENSKYPKGSPVCEILVPGETDCWEDIDTYEQVVTVLPDSVGQFTGLQDKAGRDIYEGDILRLDTVIEACLLFDTPERHLRALFKVVYKDDYAGFDVEEIEDPEEEPVGGWSLIKDCQEDWEIVGNVYETPELLTNLPTLIPHPPIYEYRDNKDPLPPRHLPDYR